VSDSRIGLSFLYPGCGWGGSCFPKDVQALYATGRENGIELSILRAVQDVNAEQKQALLKMALKHFGNEPGREDVRGLGIGLQAEHRRYAGGAVDSANRGPARQG